MEDAICWAVNIQKSKLREIYWSHSWKDLTSILKLKVGHELAMVYQDQQNLAVVVGSIFGGDPKKSNVPIQSSEEMVNKFSSMMGPQSIMKR